MARRVLPGQRLAAGGWLVLERREWLARLLGAVGWWGRVHRERLERPLAEGGWLGLDLLGGVRPKPRGRVLKSA